jgi:hypothetical protein
MNLFPTPKPDFCEIQLDDLDAVVGGKTNEQIIGGALYDGVKSALKGNLWGGVKAVGRMLFESSPLNEGEDAQVRAMNEEWAKNHPQTDTQTDQSDQHDQSAEDASGSGNGGYDAAGDNGGDTSGSGGYDGGSSGGYDGGGSGGGYDGGGSGGGYDGGSTGGGGGYDGGGYQS